MRTTIGSQGEGLVFLLGLPRSGTTLLSMMLDNHPDVASPPEPWLMLAFAELGRVAARHPANASVLGTAVRRFIGEEGRVIAARAAGRALYDAHLEACGKRVLVDKTPRYWLIPEFLIEVFPQARFIWLRRDPMDIAASYRTTWGIDLAAVFEQCCDVPELFDLTVGLDRLTDFHKNHPDAVHVVFYERLTAAPGKELAKVLSHFGIKVASPQVDSLTVLDASKRPREAFGDPKISATRAPHTKSIGTWRRSLDHAQLQIILDAVGAERLVGLGYANTLAALQAVGIRPCAASVTAKLHATAEAHLAAREADIHRVTTYGSGDKALANAQPRIHAALAGDADWKRLVETEVRRLNAPLREHDQREGTAGHFAVPMRWGRWAKRFV